MLSKLALALGVLVLVGVLISGLMIGLSESGEVVVLRTFDAAGEVQETRLWVIEHDGSSWLRSGDPASSWLARIRAHPGVEVQWDEAWMAFVAQPEPDETPIINALMREKYDLADRMISALMRDDDVSVAIRLVPAAGSE